jgi:hypothetical protein
MSVSGASGRGGADRFSPEPWKTGGVALMSSPRLSRVVALGVLGLVGCGVALALAGPSPRPPADPHDARPGDVAKVMDYRCAQDLATASEAFATTTVEQVGPEEPETCWRIVVVRSANETGNELADRLTKQYGDRGFAMTGMTTGEVRSVVGTLAPCGTTVAIDTGGQEAAVQPPGSRAGSPPVTAPAGGFPTDGQVPPMSVPDGAAPSSTPEGAVPSSSVVTPSSLNLTPFIAGNPADPSGAYPAAGSDPLQLLATLAPTRKGGAVMVASQQARAVLPRALEGRC